MPKIKLPQKNQQWEVSYLGDYFGDIIETFNLDFDTNQGKIALSKKLYPHTVTQDLAIQVPTSFLYTDFNSASGVKSYLAAADKIFLSLYASTVFAADTLTDTPASMSDAEVVVHGRSSIPSDIIVLNKGPSYTDLYRFNRDISTTTWNKTWWTVTLGQAALISGVPHILKTFGNSPLLFILDGNLLHSVGTPGTVAVPATSADVSNSRLIFKKGYIGNWMVTTSQKVYLGLKDSRSNDLPSLIEEYDPFNEQVREWVIDEGITIGYYDNNNVSIVDYKGVIRKFDGNSFASISEFPIAHTDGLVMESMIHRNGIASIEKKTYYLVISAFQYNMPSGIWVYEPQAKRLYHKVAPANDKTYIVAYGDCRTYAGALFNIGRGEFFAGIEVNKDGTTLAKGIYSSFVGPGVNQNSSAMVGYFKTAKIKSSEISDTFRNILIKYTARRFPLGVQSGGEITVKYRKIDNKNNVSNFNAFEATWTFPAVFTIATASLTNVSVGDEAFIWSGNGAGLSAHIISITPSGSNSIVVIDDSVSEGGSPTGTMYVIFEGWRKLLPAISATDRQSLLLDIPEGESEYIQFKVQIKGTLDIDEIQVGIEPGLKVEK